MEEVLSSERISSACFSAARSLARLAISLGLVVLIGGWGFRISFLSPQSAPTAIGIILLGTSLWMLVANAAKRSLRVLRIFSAIAAPTIAMFSGLSPQTTTCLVLVGLALILFDLSHRSRRPAQLLAIAAMLIAWFALVGHAFHTMLPALRLHAGMSIYTALAIVALSVGALLTRPASGLMVTFTGGTAGSIMLRRLIPGALISLPLLGAIAGIGVRYELYSQGTALALVFLSAVFLGVIAAWFTAQTLNRAEQRLREARATELSLRQRIEGMSEAATTICEAVAALPKSDLHALLQVIVLKAQSLTGADLAAFGIGDDPNCPFSPWVFSGVSDEQARAIGRSPSPVGTLGVVAREGKTLRLRDIHQHPAMRGLPRGHPPIRSFLGVPVRFRGKTVGNLYLANKRGAREFSTEDLRITEMLASRAGIAIETARLYKTEEVGRAWLSGVIDQMPEGVIIADRQGRVVSQNQAAVRLSSEAGLYERQVGQGIVFDLRHSTGERVPWEDTPLARAALRRETVLGVDLLLVTKAGDKIHVRVSATPVRGPGEESSGAVAILSDITNLKEVQRMREEWTSVIAHDLRQPVNVISLAANILKNRCQGRLSEIEAMALTRIESSAGNLSRMIRDLLDTSCIEAKRLCMEKTSADLPTLLRETVAQMQGIAPDRKIQVCFCDDEHHAVLADPRRIEQVVSNLLSNAIKYGDPGSPVEVGLKRRNGELLVSVSNYGPGIQPEHMPHLFERFYRAARTGPRAAGVGLGLYICKGIVEAHDGRIWAESVPGERTTFLFSLPELREELENLPRAV